MTDRHPCRFHGGPLDGETRDLPLARQRMHVDDLIDPHRCADAPEGHYVSEGHGPTPWAYRWVAA